jgi:hypothetical protein
MTRSLTRGDLIPHFTVKTLDGASFSYSTIWQRRNLVLIALPVVDSEFSRRYVSELSGCSAEFNRADAACVITRDPIAGLPGPGVLVADRWGEIVYVVTTSDVSELTRAEELLDWLRYVQIRCPECEGEAR